MKTTNPHGWPTDPPRVDDSIRERAARTIAAQLAKYCGDEFNDDGTWQDIVGATKTGLARDGYEIARALDERFHWSPDAQIVEVLDEFSSVLDRELEKARAEWVKFYDIKPPLEIGDRVRFDRGRSTGLIEAVDEHWAGAFKVKWDGETRPSCWRIVRFEDCAADAN